ARSESAKGRVTVTSPSPRAPPRSPCQAERAPPRNAFLRAGAEEHRAMGKQLRAGISVHGARENSWGRIGNPSPLATTPLLLFRASDSDERRSADGVGSGS